MRDDDPRDWGNRDEHQIIAFVASAVLILGSLLLFASLVAGEEHVESPGIVPSSLAQQGAPSFAAQEDVAGSLTDTRRSALFGSLGTAAVQAPAPPARLVQPSTPPPEVSARSYAVIERSCGALLYGERERDHLPPASLTKIITAMLVERLASADERVDVQVSGSQMAKRGSSVMGIEPGMNLSVLELLYGLFLPSGNDAALALAEYVGEGSVERFVDLMNEEARRLGMKDTHFANPHGLDNGGLYSSALDMAIAGRAYLEVPLLSQIATTPEYRYGPEDVLLRNGNRLLQVYPGSFGVKIGYTTKAKQTIVAAASHGGRELIISVFGSEDRYTDSIAIFDWAFASLPNGCENR